MRIRNKALLVMLGASMVFITLMSAVLVDVVTNYFSRSEQRSVRQRAKVVEAILGADLARLQLVAMQYGNWDDLRKFVNVATKRSEPAFDTTGFNAKEFLVSTLEEPKYVIQEQRHGVFISDEYGNILFADKMLEDNKTFSAPDSELRALLVPALRQPISRSVAGVLRLSDDRFVAIGVAPILNNDGSLDRRGNIAFYREYRAAEMAYFYSRIGFKFYFTKSASLRRADEESALLGMKIAGSAKSRELTGATLMDQDFAVDPSKATLEGEISLWLDAGPGDEITSANASERAPDMRDFGFLKTASIWLFPQFDGERSLVLNTSLLSSIFTTLSFAVIVYVIIGNWLVRPAENLLSQIQEMIAHPQAGARIIERNSNDEFRNLTSAFNGLLGQVESQEASLRKQERLAMLGTMQAEFAHEVANPLSALVAYSRRVNEHIAEPERLEENKRHLEKIDRIGSFLTKLLNTFRRASRASATRAHWQDHDIGEILDMAAVIGNVKAKKLGTLLDVSLPQEPVLVHADSSQVLQIINNLISNGIDAASMNANQGHGWVRVKCDVIADQVVITVADSGPGIAAEIKKKLFTKFATTKSSGAGTGLGLALSAEIIREVGGSLGLLELATHTTFEVKIPVAHGRLSKVV